MFSTTDKPTGLENSVYNLVPDRWKDVTLPKIGGQKSKKLMNEVYMNCVNKLPQYSMIEILDEVSSYIFDPDNNGIWNFFKLLEPTTQKKIMRTLYDQLKDR